MPGARTLHRVKSLFKTSVHEHAARGRPRQQERLAAQSGDYRRRLLVRPFCGISPFDVASSHSGKISEPTRRATAWPTAKLLPSEKWIPSIPSVDIISPASRNAI